MVEKMLNQFQQGSKESFRWDDDLLLVAYLEGKKLKSVMEKRRRKVVYGVLLSCSHLPVLSS
jgi:hypothetical protein